MEVTLYHSLFQLLGGLVLLTVGAELLVRAAVSIARRIGLSPLIIGLTVVSVGTSLPELVVCVDAALQGNGALGVGNVVGSNISNIALILGLAALVRPLVVEAQVVQVDGPILVGVSVLLVALVWDSRLGRFDGLLLAGGVVGYIAYNVWAAQKEPGEIQEEFDSGIPSQHNLGWDLGFLVLGIGGLVGGADLLVDGAVHVARVLRVPQLVIGLSVVAVGTSLPELATSVLASYRGEGDIAVGNAVGSSIFNILGILGVTALVQPLSTARLSVVELGVMVGVAVLLLPLLRSHFTLSRREGCFLLVVYLGYLCYLAVLGVGG